MYGKDHQGVGRGIEAEGSSVFLKMKVGFKVIFNNFTENILRGSDNEIRINGFMQ